MVTQPVSLAGDRTICVPAGTIVHTGYVDIFKIRLACRDRMAIGDVDRAYQKVIQLGDNSSFPAPVGFWDGDVFMLQDGRHEWVASLMLGKSHILVAWLAKSKAMIDHVR